MTVVPHDAKDFLYAVPFFRVERGGTLHMKLDDDSIVRLVVGDEDYVKPQVAVRRIFQTGTSASGFQTDTVLPKTAADYFQRVPYSDEGDLLRNILLLEEPDAGGILLEDGSPIRNS